MLALSLTLHKESGARWHRTFVQAKGLAVDLVRFRKSWDSCFFSHFLTWMLSWEDGAAAQSSWIPPSGDDDVEKDVGGLLA